MELQKIYYRKSKKQRSHSKGCESHYTEKYLDKAGLPNQVRSVVGEWMMHCGKNFAMDNKATRTEFLELLTEFKKNVAQYGTQAVCQLVEDCISQNTKRILWKNLKT